MVEVRPIPDVSVTADEMRQRECPLIRYCVNEGVVAGSDASAIHAHALCRADGCPGWRWAHGELRRFFVTPPGKPEEEWNWNPTGSKGYEEYIVRIASEPPRGFCGYAGRPAHG